MENDVILKRNLLAIAPRNPWLVEQMSGVRIDDTVKVCYSRTNKPVPLYYSKGKDYPLHSLVNPEREGKRLASGFYQNGCVICLGLGGAYHLMPFLAQKTIDSILIIDSEPERFKALLAKLNLVALFGDSRVNCLVGALPDQICSFVTEHCLPVISNNIQIIHLRSRVQIDIDYFGRAYETVKQTVATISRDYAVQAAFGRCWFVNTVRNLPTIQASCCVIPSAVEATIIAAGPSLEACLEEPGFWKNKGLLIATDTAYPVLKRHSIRPDLVVSIDCQPVSCFHFLDGFDASIPLVMDIAVPSTIARLSEKPVFFAGCHPLARYLYLYWRKLPLLDTSGGNVTYVAVALAAQLGCKKIRLAGADFGFPLAKSYARGSYLYDFFASRSSRFGAEENSFYRLVFDDRSLKKTTINGLPFYANDLHNNYKQSLEKMVGHLGVDILQAPGQGQIFKVSQRRQNLSSDHQVSLFNGSKESCDWKDFLWNYQKILSCLPKPTDPVMDFIRCLPGKQQEFWFTLMPLAAWLRRNNKSGPGSLILESAQSWAINYLNQRL